MTIEDIFRLSKLLNRHVVHNKFHISGLKHLVEAAVKIESNIHVVLCFDKRDAELKISASGTIMEVNLALTSSDLTRNATNTTVQKAMIDKIVEKTTATLYSKLKPREKKGCKSPKPCLKTWKIGAPKQPSISKTTDALVSYRFTHAFSGFIIDNYKLGFFCTGFSRIDKPSDIGRVLSDCENKYKRVKEAKKRSDDNPGDDRLKGKFNEEKKIFEDRMRSANNNYDSLTDKQKRVAKKRSSDLVIPSLSDSDDIRKLVGKILSYEPSKCSH